MLARDDTILKEDRPGAEPQAKPEGKESFEELSGKIDMEQFIDEQARI